MYRVLTPEDAPALVRIGSLAFGSSPEEIERWWARAGHDSLRVLVENGTVVGGLLDIPMGMFAGGRSVSNHGVAGVAVAPEARGRGVGHRLMASYLEELSSAGVALSTLYASTRGLYRSVGYGIAGTLYDHALPTEQLRAAGERDTRWRPALESDWSAIQEAYAAWSTHRTGHMDRGPYLWNRVQNGRDGQPRPTWVLEDGGLAAWVVLTQEQTSPWFTLQLVDHGARDAAALGRVASFVGGFSSMARQVKLKSGPVCPLLEMLPEQRVETVLVEPWMTRIVRVREALEARGWPEGLAVVLDLEVSDPILRDNNGRFRVRIAQGEARVQSGSDGTYKLTIQGLAGLFTGHASPWELRARGALSCPDSALGALTAAFAGPSPGTPDFF